MGAMLSLIIISIIAAKAAYMSGAKGQSICQTDDHCDTDLGYYCNVNLFECVKCVTCENFKGGRCAKSIADCSSLSTECLEGYTFTKDGRCVSAPSFNSFTVIVTVASVVVVLAVSAGAMHVLRKKRRRPSGVDPEKNTNTNAAPPTAPIADLEYLGGPPPPYNYSYSQGTVRPINDDENSAEPLLISRPVEYMSDIGQPHTEHMQRADLVNPPNYVRNSLLPFRDPIVLPAQAEEPPPAPDDIPLQNIAVETQESHEEEDSESEENFTGQAQPGQFLQQPQLQITLNINNTNSANLLSIQQQQ